MTRIEQGTYTTCVNLHNKLKAVQKKLAPYGSYAYKAAMLALPPAAYYAATQAYFNYYGITDESLGYYDRVQKQFIYYEPYPRTNHMLNNKKVALPVIGLLAACCWPHAFAKNSKNHLKKHSTRECLL